eukprot:TRINITY_DN2991_c3_g1_i1.p1 TRINITY_DN2991_c3_g1~~TRINITY_DN2991_c3_g1_i1.p1  ORF type:complete len:278 (+),score=-29.22 TRINITY_DN2991_c3_g1_i1:124-957(+)
MYVCFYFYSTKSSIHTILCRNTNTHTHSFTQTNYQYITEQYLSSYTTLSSFNQLNYIKIPFLLNKIQTSFTIIQQYGVITRYTMQGNEAALIIYILLLASYNPSQILDLNNNISCSILFQKNQNGWYFLLQKLSKRILYLKQLLITSQDLHNQMVLLFNEQSTLKYRSMPKVIFIIKSILIILIFIQIIQLIYFLKIMIILHNCFESEYLTHPINSDCSDFLYNTPMIIIAMIMFVYAYACMYIIPQDQNKRVKDNCKLHCKNAKSRSSQQTCFLLC